jgi:coniferyl-aldehyde dehydrogenase
MSTAMQHEAPQASAGTEPLNIRSTQESLAALVARQRQALMRAGAPTSIQRREHLERLRSAILSRREDLVAAVSADFGHRCRQETELYELNSVVQGIRYLRRHLAAWMRPSRRSVPWQFMPASAWVEYVPRGVVGIMAPWNYPVALALNPLAVALAAGNRVVLKPSEKMPETAALLQSILAAAFEEDHVAVVNADAQVAAAFAALPFDHLMFTGGTVVGRSVMRLASEHLVPVTLELGGKSPAIVEPRTDIARAAERIAFGKLLNAGQTCIAPDYVLVQRQDRDAFVAAYAAAVARLYPRIETNADYTTIAHDAHRERLSAMLEDARALGAHVLELGSSSNARRHGRTFLPALVLEPRDTMRVMQEEIFGPILPIVAYKDLEDATAFVNARPPALVLYYFGFDGKQRARVRLATTSGAFVTNDTILHYAIEDLPFGGVGASGMGAYHGREGFVQLSQARALMAQGRRSATRYVRPPFGPLVERIIRMMLR